MQLDKTEANEDNILQPSNLTTHKQYSEIKLQSKENTTKY